MKEVINKLIVMWGSGIPFRFNLYADPICAILKRKMLLVGLDAVIPDHLYAVVSVLSNGNPGMCQIILKEILMASREDVKNALAMGVYLDLSVMDKVMLRFRGKLPDAQDSAVAETLERLYMEQKIQSKETLSDNAMDTQQYWAEVTMQGRIDESVPYNERFKFYEKKRRS
mgnify:FL=1